jgi:hypothetical protein
MMARRERAIMALPPQPPCVSASGQHRIWAGRSPCSTFSGNACATSGRSR